MANIIRVGTLGEKKKTYPNVTNLLATNAGLISWQLPTTTETITSIELFYASKDISNFSYEDCIADGQVAKVIKSATDASHQLSGLAYNTQYWVKVFVIYGTFKSSGASATFTTPETPPFKIYGVKIDTTNSNPETSVTYTDDALGLTPKSAVFDTFFGHKPCLFKNGAVVGYLNPNDFTKFVDETTADITTGDAGDVMIEFPRRGLKIETVGTDLFVKMTDNPNDVNFEYNAHQRGVADKDYFYLGAYKGFKDASSKLRSLSGKTPTVTQTIATFRTQAQANGAGYEQSGFYQLVFRQCMYLLKYKNLNSQTALGRGYVDGNSAAIVTGGTNPKGMDFGETTGKLQMKLFGIEDFWGNVYEFIDGLVTNVSRQILTANSSFNNTGSGYVNNGQGATTNIISYMSKPQANTKTGFVAREVSGSATTYFCDIASLYASCIAYYGGDWSNASSAGAFTLNINIDNSSSDANRASRLMYL